ncbi:phosphate ABC transporter permease subunit PstC [Kutzneria sp. CA-103260]|uniref:phosphate ABC transporter permease subunit PstC n=1 Tax=Kutzneria sp. CA-103260 TaxID=2802641 RepID=UPI001BF10538|nr:phosphate ABC transporter permease subunit PstC [Kutzneria sp. CA-103260]QUQ63558.1 phosphate ABC transporter permease [Kutzneria sp. CA-103260]
MTDEARPIRSAAPLGDLAFRGVARGGGLLMLLITGGIGVFLAIRALPTLQTYGLGFLTTTVWNPDAGHAGILSVITGTALVALVAIVISFPLAMLVALYISEYAPRRLRATLITVVDLMAAVPSVIYGLWGFYTLQPAAHFLARWLHTYLGFLPFFQVDTDPRAALWEQPLYEKSMFISGIAVSMMVIPMACSVMREVFSQTPQGEREAALALGGTRWGMIRAVVLPFGRGGVIGGTMLGLGRALGETIAVSLIISPTFDLTDHILQRGGNTIASMIALRFGDASPTQLSALLAAGFVLFLMTVVVNLLAGVIVARSRSGAATEI